MSSPSSIIGHTQQLAALTQDITQENVAHAYLFSGPRHLGKMTVAKHFACQLLCNGQSEDAAKEICRRAEKLLHPDLLVLDTLWMEGVHDDWDVLAKTSNVPQLHRSKAPKAKTDSISIDDIRAIQQRLYETGTSGQYRCLIMRSVERMQDAAVNAFLKLLEEPPSGVVFILTTQQQSLLLPTLLSRCRVLPFLRLPQEDMRMAMEHCDEDDIQFIQHIAQGAPGVAIELCNNTDALREHKLCHEQMMHFWKKASPLERFKSLSALQKRGDEAKRTLLHLSLALRSQQPGQLQQYAPALSSLEQSLQTNAHRGLIIQRFVLEVSQ